MSASECPEYPVAGREGAIASPHYLASLAGARILQEGGNAVEAAVCANAVLGVVYPHMCGLGGDLFMLIYSAREDRLLGLNASGRSPALATRSFFSQRRFTSIPSRGILSITVPGAVSGWSVALERFGKRNLGELLEPAIHYAEEGFPVSFRLSHWIKECSTLLSLDPESRRIFLPGDSVPAPGQILRQGDLANSLRAIARGGAEAFYRGPLAQAIARFCERRGGLLRAEDLASHRSDWVDPIHTSYQGYQIYQLPPNTQGLAMLLELNLAEGFDLAALGLHTADYIHLGAEIKKLAFADRDAYLTDPDFAQIPVEWLCSKEYARRRIREIDLYRANPEPKPGPSLAGDTIYLCTADGEGNLVSLIQSLYLPFGSGLTVEGCGIVLQNRGSYFSLREDHSNRLEPRKRTLHTLIPALAFHRGRPYLVFGTMGGEGQPQTQFQVLCHLLHFGMNLQQAISSPRWLMGPRSLGDPPCLYLERGIPEEVEGGLEERGHSVRWVERGAEFFGHAHAIQVEYRSQGRIYWAASDPRSDGCALAW